MIIAVLLSILFITLSFPTVIGSFHFPDLGPLVWIGWVPLLMAYRRSLRRSFWAPFGVALGYYFFSMYWLFFAMRNFGGISGTGSILVLLLLCAMLAVYAGVVFKLASWLERRFRIPFSLGLPILWALSEWARTISPFGGYPWSSLPYALGRDLYAMQWAEWIGITGLNAVIMLVNVLIAQAAGNWLLGHSREGGNPAFQAIVDPRLREDDVFKKSLKYLISAILILAVVHGAGYWRYHTLDSKLSKLQSERTSIQVALVQGNILQDDKWDPQEAERIRTQYQYGTQQAADAGAQVVVWPEAAYPYTLGKTEAVLPWFDEWMREGQHLLIGALMREGRRSYNSAVWIDDAGRVSDSVDKVHLVPFGEYVPYQDYLTFAEALTQAVGEFYPGEKGHPLETPYGPWGVLICYEDLFPALSKDLVRAGAEILVNLTNDAWYEHSSAPYQHVVYSQYRALESRRYLLRATNTGITAVIDPLGRVIATLPWFQEKTLMTQVWSIKVGDL